MPASREKIPGPGEDPAPGDILLLALKARAYPAPPIAVGLRLPARARAGERTRRAPLQRVSAACPPGRRDRRVRLGPPRIRHRGDRRGSARAIGGPLAGTCPARRARPPRGEGDRRVAGVERTAEAAVGRTLGGHEQMFTHPGEAQANRKPTVKAGRRGLALAARRGRAKLQRFDVRSGDPRKEAEGRDRGLGRAAWRGFWGKPLSGLERRPAPSRCNAARPHGQCCSRQRSKSASDPLTGIPSGASRNWRSRSTLACRTGGREWEMKLDLQTVALVAIAAALWVAVFEGFNAF